MPILVCHMLLLLLLLVLLLHLWWWALLRFGDVLFVVLVKDALTLRR